MVVLVLIQIVVVIGISRIFGWGFRKISQPLVIGEIVAGIALGPSLLGLLSPDLSATLFPAATIPYLSVLSQVGLIFFMFLIGLELDPKYLQGNLNIAVLTSTVSIIVPFSLAGILSLFIYPLVSSASVSFTAFALFMGAAMSITAFPVLARIITENNLQNSRLGTLALTCAAVDDVTAWCLLALAIAVTRTNSIASAVPQIIYSILYIGLMLTVGRWMLKMLSTYYDRTGKLSQILLAAIYMAVVISALITETIGIHLIFGAFLLGAAMPKNPGLVREIAEKTEDFVLIFLLPIFFAYSGLKTQIGLIDSLELWLLCGAILLVAIAGKYIGTYFAARRFNMSKREASALGWLMNTRGLTELIVLNIGLDLGVISPLLFTMLVIMALVTTFMTSPLLEWTFPKHAIRLDANPPSAPTDAPPAAPAAYRVLLPVANPKTQQGLLQLAVAIAHNDTQEAIVNPLSLIELEEDYHYQSTPLEADRAISNKLAKLQDSIDLLDLPTEREIVKPIVEVGQDIAQRTAIIADRERPDLILMGWHRPTLTKNRLGGRVAQMLALAPADVAVFIDANTIAPHAYRRLLVPYRGNNHDELALALALRLIASDNRRSLHILQAAVDRDTTGEIGNELEKMCGELPASWQERIKIENITTHNPIDVAIELSQQVDLTLAGISSNNRSRQNPILSPYTQELALNCASSLLITRRYSQYRSHLAPSIPV
jgi:Kef-type K+ transport system membrane component KefB/nucleotide-binding universal stress UspA family protein